MPSGHLKPTSLFHALLICTAVLYGSGAAAAEMAPQSSQAGGLTISVKPTDVSPQAATWRFQVGMNTHSVELSDDLARTAALVDASGKEQPALAWEGDPPGGHHRKGELRFKALSPRPQALELRIARAGEAAPRVFRWKLK